MNIKVKSMAAMTVFLFLFSFCNGKKETPQNGDSMETPRYFKTPQEAAQKAKQDLLEAMEAHKNLNTGIDPARLKKASPSVMVEYNELDFAKILATQEVENLGSLVLSRRGNIVPFVLDGTVIGVVEINNSQEGWEISGLANKSLTDDLNASRLIAKGKTKITLYELPNLQLRIYAAAGLLRREVYYTNFEQLRIDDSVPISTLYPLLRKKSQEFEKLYGKELKEKQLLK